MGQKALTETGVQRNIKTIVGYFFACLVFLMLATSAFASQPVEINEDFQYDRIPAATYTETEMRNFLRELSRVEPEKAADLLLAYTNRFDLDARPPSLVNKNEDMVIVGNRQFIPHQGVEEYLKHFVERAKPEEKVMAVIQMERMPSLRDYIEFCQMGVRGLFNSGYVGRKAYIIAFPSKQFHVLTKSQQLKWLGYYEPSSKITVEYQGYANALVKPVDWDRDEYRDAMNQLGIKVNHFDKSLGSYDVDMVDPTKAYELTEQWWVRSIAFRQKTTIETISDEDLPNKFQAQDSRLMSGADGMWVFRSGKGITVGILDTMPDEEHSDFPSGAFASGSDTGQDPHGTHVAGIIAARNSGENDLAGTYAAQGMAPESTLYSVDGWGDDFYSGAFLRFEENEVRVSNHSWGYRNYSYNEHTENFDAYVADNDFILVKSAGNDGPNSSTITNPGTGKNILTVGAVRYVTDDDLDDRDIGGVTVYSSRGPSQGRLKPELVAPGGQRFGDYGYHKYGVISLNPRENTGAAVWPDGNDQYLRMPGTSMAAPHVTGAVGAMLEWMSDWNIESYSRYVKARLIATTIPLKESNLSASSGYSNTNFGYGLLNAFNASGIHVPSESETLGSWSDTLTSYTGFL